MDYVYANVTVERAKGDTPETAVPGDVFQPRDAKELSLLQSLQAVEVATDEQIAVAKVRGQFFAAVEAVEEPVKVQKSGKAAKSVPADTVPGASGGDTVAGGSGDGSLV